MVKGKGRASRREEEEQDPYGLNEVDEFAAKNERILLENSTLYNENGQTDEDKLDDDDEEAVMDISDIDESEDEDENEMQVESEKAYRQIFGRSLKDDQRPLEDEEAILDNENAWGSTKNEYYGADDLDDDETAKEIEKEALRQQKKHLQELNMTDYLDDEIEEEWVQNAKEFDVSEFQQSTRQTSNNNISLKDVRNMNQESKEKYFKTMFPEYLPLCKEFTQLTEVLNKLKNSKQDNEFVKIKAIALSTYLGSIAAYLGVLSHEFNNNEDFTTMKNHPVMEAILTTKEIWRQANELPNSFDSNTQKERNTNFEYDDNDMVEDVQEIDKEIFNNIPGNENNETDDNADNNMANENDSDNSDEADLDDFEEYVGLSRIDRKSPKQIMTFADKESHKTNNVELVDDFVESEMAEIDAQEKKKRKKSLRFYTSKIDQQSNKKMDRFMGDDDIPYKERLYERQQRLLEEARQRGLHDKNGTDLGVDDYDSQEEAAIAKSVNDQSINDYYHQIQRNREERKQSRKEAHKTALIAARDGKLADAIEAVGEDGKRAINYQILKNKGLTPKRKKENRNARVKKRKKYEKAQKKLKSVRAVYSGGQSGVYEGEKTGIKKNLTRSVKFRN
ncbi:rRNA-processing protein SAS10 PWA37_001695 [Arxiozyma heterogenica]|uniref:Sas10 C-terminal domain-containing protein n=1 Tax=Arxiozyma heterogenica TaxID=278026 RepID=A0AAN7WLU6_9SACH|nr:hypothetical protein RI543_002474 [Kazachstania heterogenica]